MPISDPTGIDNTLVAWFDAAHAASFTYSSGSIVSQWNDRSSFARHASQGTTANQPVRNGTQNGLSTVVFDGTNDLLLSSTWDWPPYNPFTLFVLWKPTRDSGSDQAIVTADSGTGLVFHRSSDRFVIFQLGGETGAPTDVTFDEWHYATHQANSTSSIQRIDGAQVGTTTMTNDTNVGLLRTCLGGVNWGGLNFQGEIAEYVAYDGVLTSGEITDVEDYLVDKWFGTPDPPPSLILRTAQSGLRLA